MIKEQILIVRVRYDDEYDRSPHTWNWTDLIRSDHEVEVVNHGKPEEVREDR